MITITQAELERDFDDILDDVIENGALYTITDNDGKNPVVLMPYDAKLFASLETEEDE
jgi:PHD/YefM family antitoxin component YafN of YafNO toxin-antitoxin module